MFTHEEWEAYKKIKESEDIEFEDFLKDWRNSNGPTLTDEGEDANIIFAPSAGAVWTVEQREMLNDVVEDETPQVDSFVQRALDIAEKIAEEEQPKQESIMDITRRFF